MSKFTNFKNKIISKVYGVKYFSIKNSDEQNIKQAQSFVNEIIRLNDEAVERYNELLRYVDSESYSTVTAYILSNKIYNVLDRKNLTFDNATEYVDSLINKEYDNIENAIKHLKPLAIEKLKEQGKIVCEDDIVLDDLFNQKLFFNESQAEYFARLKNNYILKTLEPESYFDKLFYKYYNGYLLQDIYMGFHYVLETIYHYVEYNEDQLEEVTSFRDFPLSTKFLPWMKNIDMGTTYSVPKELIDNVFGAISKARQDIVLSGVKINKCLQTCLTECEKEEYIKQQNANEIQLDNIKIFEYHAGYLKYRITITNRTRTLDDDKKVVMSGTDLATLIEFSLDVEQAKDDSIKLIEHFTKEQSSVPFIFVLSDYIRNYVDLNEVSVYDTDNHKMSMDSIQNMLNDGNSDTSAMEE